MLQITNHKMKAHLIKSNEVSTELFTKVVGLLQAEAGIIEFSYDSDSIIDFNEEELYVKEIKTEKKFREKDRLLSCSLKESNINFEFPLKRETAKWKNLFNKCSDYRLFNKIDSTDFVLLLTDIPNEHNWFASLQEKMSFNGFVHTADWDYFIDCPAEFPIAYEVIALMLQKHMFDGLYDVRTKVHEKPIGCISDFCANKKEIILKLRTADICRSCMERLKGKLSMPEIFHALKIMESLRVKMLYAQNFRQESPLSKLIITAKHKIFLPDFGNIEIKLRPLEKALYFLFLKHPDGIYLSSLSNHREELYEIYCGICYQGVMKEMKSRIDDIVNALSNSSAEKISRIKRVFEDTIGKDLANHYCIRGEHGEMKKIALDRGMVVLNGN